MKNTIAILFACGALLASCQHKPAPEPEPEATPAEQLISRLQALQESGNFAFGHHDDPAYGVNWAYCPDSSDVKNVCGDYPAIFDWDLGEIELGGDAQIDGVPLQFIKEQSVKQAARGGINAFSWHLRNPITGGDSWDISDKTVVNAVLTDSATNAKMRQWMGAVADFLGELRDSTGTRVPVIFRPWHEHTGSWFWWGDNLCTPEEYVALWKLTREVFDQKGLDNVVWAYSPDRNGGSTVESYMAKYPGDDLVDIMGADIYYWGGDNGPELFDQWVKEMLGNAATLAKEHGKVLALTETGSEQLKPGNFFNGILYPALEGVPVAYVTVWRNATNESKPGHYYAPYAGHSASADFVDFYQQPRTFFAEDMKNVK